MLVALGVLFWPKSVEDATGDEVADDHIDPELLRPNGVYRSDGLHEAA
jgi:hypothetical protein